MPLKEITRTKTVKEDYQDTVVDLVEDSDVMGYGTAKLRLQRISPKHDLNRYELTVTSDDGGEDIPSSFYFYLDTLKEFSEDVAAFVQAEMNRLGPTVLVEEHSDGTATVIDGDHRREAAHRG